MYYSPSNTLSEETATWSPYWYPWNIGNVPNPQLHQPIAYTQVKTKGESEFSNGDTGMVGNGLHQFNKDAIGMSTGQTSYNQEQSYNQNSKNI